MTSARPPAGNVFLVEDEVMIRMMVADMLVELGYSVAAEAGEISEAMKLAQSADFDIAILDVNVNGKMISPVAELIHARNRPFIFATGYGSSGLPEEYRDRPALQKPFQLETLARVIETTLKAWPLRPWFALLQRRRQRFRKIKVGSIEPQRCHGNVALLQRREIGAFRRHIDLGLAFEPDPEIRVSAAIAPLIDLQEAEIALALPRNPHARDLVGQAGRKIDIDHRVLGNAGIDHLAQDRWAEFQRRIPQRRVAGFHAELLRQCEGRQSQNRTFQGAGDGAGIDDIFGDVATLVDA
jgi:CheY-like chemotaxis protein